MTDLYNHLSRMVAHQDQWHLLTPHPKIEALRGYLDPASRRLVMTTLEAIRDMFVDRVRESSRASHRTACFPALEYRRGLNDDADQKNFKGPKL